MGALAVALGLGSRASMLLELADVGADREGPAACSPQNDAAQAFVLVELGEDFIQPVPHQQAHRIELILLVQGNGGDISLALDGHALHHGGPPKCLL